MGNEINFEKFISRKLLDLQPYNTKIYDHMIKLDAMEMCLEAEQALCRPIDDIDIPPDAPPNGPN